MRRRSNEGDFLATQQPNLTELMWWSLDDWQRGPLSDNTCQMVYSPSCQATDAGPVILTGLNLVRLRSAKTVQRASVLVRRDTGPMLHATDAGPVILTGLNLGRLRVARTVQ